jgi:O-antigen ligase
MAALFFVCVLAVAMYVVMPKAPFERFFSTDVTGRARGDSIDFRIELWKSGLMMAIDHPLFGVGIQCFGHALFHAYPLPFGRGLWYGPHNNFIQIIAELGIPAFLCYLGIYYMNFKDVKIIRRSLNKEHIKPEVKREISILSQAFEISLVGFTITGLFVANTYGLNMFLITGFIIVLRRITEQLAYNSQPHVGMDRIPTVAVK